MIVEIDDAAGLGPGAFATQLDRLNDGTRELIIAGVRPGPCEARVLAAVRAGTRPAVIVVTSDTLSWDRLWARGTLFEALFDG
jgi:hypothetical protein